MEDESLGSLVVRRGDGGRRGSLHDHRRFDVPTRTRRNSGQLRNAARDPTQPLLMTLCSSAGQSMSGRAAQCLGLGDKSGPQRFSTRDGGKW